MDIIRTVASLQFASKQKGKIGFVPTMGALHEGHLSLIRQAKKMCDFVICSVFVNPTQFNDKKDLTNYPRTEEKDIEMLISAGCDLAFLPSIEEVYPDYPNQTTFINIDLFPLDKVMEGSSRPGHFDGVVNVVYRLFDIVKPDVAFFGQKDFQQVSIINYMVKKLELPIQIITSPTLRNEFGLAMSSRNTLLSSEQQKEALILIETLNFGKSIANNFTPKEVKAQMITLFEKGTLRLDYLEIANSQTLMPLENEWNSNAVICIAAYCGNVRLIDNILLFV